MEGPIITRRHDHGDKSLKFLLDTFGSAFSIGEIASAFCKAGRDVNVAGEILRGMQTVPSADGTRLSKASKSKTSPASMSTISTVGQSYAWRVVGSNGTSDGTMPLKLEAAAVDIGSSDGKNYVWRVVGSNGTSNGTMPLKVGVASVDTGSSDGDGKNYVWRVVGSNGTSNGTNTLQVGAASVDTGSSDGKKYVWRVVGSNGASNETTPLKVRAASVDTGSSVGKNYVWRVAASNETSNGTMPIEIGEASVATGSTVGKNYIWRVAASNETSNGTMPLKIGSTCVATSSTVGKNYIWRAAASNRTSNGTTPCKVETTLVANAANGTSVHDETPNREKPLKGEAPSVFTSSSVREKNCVWRVVGSNGARDGKRPLKVEANGFHVPVKISDKPLLPRDADLGSFETSSLESNPSSDDNMENFLFDMFGHGFQLERSTIRDMLGRCGYDMKKSLEALLDLTAVTLDRRNNLLEGRHLHSNSKNLSSSSRIQKQAYAISNGCSTMRSNLVPLSQSNEKYDRQEESLAAAFPAPEQRNLSFSASVPGSATSSYTTREVVIEPVKDIAEDFKAKATMSQLDKLKEGSYNTLRKAVKEHRETMKKYYKEAAEAFARGDRDQALVLLEKGQFFYKKAREADEESVTKIFETSYSTGDNMVEDEVSLDLQDHSVKEAIQLVKLHLRTLSGIPFVRDLKIVIGNGDRDVKKLKRLIFKLLDKEGISWIEDEKCGTILIRLDEINPKTLSFGRKVCQI
ncbi:unnamed protein product [Amaranthus hypochondriacus]